MTIKLLTWSKLAALCVLSGLSFSLWNRLIDFCIDSVTAHVSWLAWLN